MIAEQYEKGNGVKQDYTNAKKYYTRACDFGFQQACNKYKSLKPKDKPSLKSLKPNDNSTLKSLGSKKNRIKE